MTYIKSESQHCLKSRVAADTLTAFGVMLAVAAGSLLAKCAGERLPIESRRLPNADLGWSVCVAGLLLLASGTMDALDGRFARYFGAASPLGAVLDSTADRLSDSVILAGCAINFAASRNLFGVSAAWAATTNAFIISYLRAKGEKFGFDLDSGFWRRPERICTLALGCLAGHVEAAVVWTAVSSTLTIAHRFALIRRRLGNPNWACTEVARVHRRGFAYLSVLTLTVAFVVLDPLPQLQHCWSELARSIAAVLNYMPTISIK